MIWRRIKNLWKLSEYSVRPEITDYYSGAGKISMEGNALVKDFPTVEKKLAKIVTEPPNYFDGDSDERVS